MITHQPSHNRTENANPRVLEWSSREKIKIWKNVSNHGPSLLENRQKQKNGDNFLLWTSTFPAGMPRTPDFKCVKPGIGTMTSHQL